MKTLLSTVLLFGCSLAVTHGGLCQPSLLSVRSGGIDPAVDPLRIERFDSARAPRLNSIEENDKWDKFQTTADLTARVAYDEWMAVADGIQTMSTAQLTTTYRKLLSEQAIAKKAVEVMRELKPEETAVFERQAADEAERQVRQDPDAVRRAVLHIQYQRATASIWYTRFLATERSRLAWRNGPPVDNRPRMQAATQQTVGRPQRPFGPRPQPTLPALIAQGVPYALEPWRQWEWMDAERDYQRRLAEWRRLPER